MKPDWRDNIKIYSVHQGEEFSLDMFDLDDHKPTLTLVGDTKYKESDMEPLRPFFRELALALTSHIPTVVIDGATDFGVMRLFGEACEQIRRRPVALIGVTLRTAIEDEKMRLEPHHTHVVLTPGSKGEWVNAVPILQEVRAVVSDKKPSALLAVGGGLITLRHMKEHARRRVPLYALLGSGYLPRGFIEAEKEVVGSDYPFLVEEHRNLLATGLVKLLDLANSQQAIDVILRTLYKSY